jgi:hypothetical protein
MGTANWKNLTQQYNSSRTSAPRQDRCRAARSGAGQQGVPPQQGLHGYTHLSDQGNEVAFGTIGDASTSEGHFWETMNAAGVLQVPLAMSVWDDGWGISVSKDYQTTKGSISTLLARLPEGGRHQRHPHLQDQSLGLCRAQPRVRRGHRPCREEHVPCLIHVEEVTQPQGHSTSGSHERYKSKELLEWYKDYDCNGQVPPVDPELPAGWHSHCQQRGTGSHREARPRPMCAAAQKAAWAAFLRPSRKS